MPHGERLCVVLATRMVCPSDTVSYSVHRILSSLKMQLSRVPQVHYYEVEEHEREEDGAGSSSRGGGGGVNGDRHAAAGVGVGYMPANVKESFRKEVTAQQQRAHGQGLLPQALPAHGGAAYGGLAGGGDTGPPRTVGLREEVREEVPMGPRRRMPSIPASSVDTEKFACL